MFSKFLCRLKPFFVAFLSTAVISQAHWDQNFAQAFSLRPMVSAAVPFFADREALPIDRVQIWGAAAWEVRALAAALALTPQALALRAQVAASLQAASVAAAAEFAALLRPSVLVEAPAVWPPVSGYLFSPHLNPALVPVDPIAYRL